MRRHRRRTETGARLSAGIKTHAGNPLKLVASLPWYDFDQDRPALDRLWDAVRKRLLSTGADESGRLPRCLKRDHASASQWADPQLLLSQCCGLDLFCAPAANLVPIARPVFAHLECAPGDYYSHVIAGSTAAPAKPVLATPRIAINAPSSYSGCAALVQWLAAHQSTPRTVLTTGSHAASVAAVRNGAADLAAIDAHTWDRLRPTGVTIIGRTTSAPSPPFVTGPHCPIGPTAIETALRDAIFKAGGDIGLVDVVPTARADYAIMARWVDAASAFNAAPVHPD